MVAAPERTRDGSPSAAVSVVLLPRPRGGPVARSIEDATAQRGVDVQVLATSADPRVQQLDLPGRPHPAEVLEAALATGGAEWFAFLEGGDRWHPEHLSAMIGLAEAADASWAHGAAILLGTRGEVIGLREPAALPGLPSRLRRGNVIGGASSVVCRRELLLERRPFDMRLSALVMWAAWIALADAPSVACSAALVAERYEDDRAMVDANALTHEARLLRVEGLVDLADVQPLSDMGERFERLGHGRDAARLHARAALATRDPRYAVRAARALRSRGRVEAPVEAPDWLRV